MNAHRGTVVSSNAAGIQIRASCNKCTCLSAMIVQCFLFKVQLSTRGSIVS